MSNEYATTETATLAAECDQHKGLHLFEDLLIIEVVDEKDQPVPPGALGNKTLVTVLFNRTEPLIRYELNDSIQLADEPCSCNLPFQIVKAIQGRTEETLYLPTFDGSKIAVHPLVFHRVMDMQRSGEWQIVNDEQGLTVLITATGANLSTTDIRAAIQKELAAQGVLVPAISVKQVSSIPKNASGKAPLIQSRPSLQ